MRGYVGWKVHFAVKRQVLCNASGGRYLLDITPVLKDVTCKRCLAVVESKGWREYSDIE